MCLCICQCQTPNLFFPTGNHSFAFYICDSVTVLKIRLFVHFLKIPHISDICLSLTSFSMINSRSIHITANDIISFLIAD